MLEQENDYWTTGERVKPYGRGINLQIEVEDVKSLRDAVRAQGVEIFADLEDSWYRQGDQETGNREFLLQDPDGYLLRFFQDLGLRPLAQEASNQGR